MGKRKGNLRRKLINVTVGPLVLTGIVILFTSYFAFSNSVHNEVRRGLQNVAVLTQKLTDHNYDGDYCLYEDNGQYSLYKGSHNLTEHSHFWQEIRQDTGIDITFFFGDMRVVTTIPEQQGESLLGTVAHPKVVKDVFVGRKEMFYEKVLVGDEPYFAYYTPLYNEDGTCIGMIFAGKPTAEVNKEILFSLLPIGIVLVFVVAMFCFICNSFTKEMTMNISRIKVFLREISKGNLKAELDCRIIQRDDELGEMGRFTICVQEFIREMIEKDILTKLYSRRIGEIKLRQAQHDAVKNGTAFTVVMGDIDHFKRFNDSYGHDCGDRVLKEVAEIMSNHMLGKGFAVRWGGEEFLIVYEGYSAKEARIWLEKMREDIIGHGIQYNDEILHVTMTFGIVEGVKMQDIAMSIKIADDFLYQGKMNGRNQIVGVTFEL